MKAIKVHNEFDGVYKKVLIRDNKVAGVVFLEIHQIVQDYLA